MNTYKIEKYELTEEQYYGREAVEGNLILNVTKLPEGFSPNFTGCVDLNNLKELNADIKSGRSLDLNNLKELNADIIAGGYVDLCNLETNNGTITENQPITYSKDNKYVIIDRILSEIINKRKSAWKLKKINSNEVFYCVTDGNGKYAHGDTIKNAKADLIYKLVDIDKSKFEGLQLTDVLSFEKCIELYRTITGACSFGVKNFVESNNIEYRDYTVQEVLDKTKNQYNSNLLVDFIK